MNALADYFFGAASACADAVPPQKPGTHSEEPTAWEFLASLGTLATEMIVWFTSCPLWALSPANAPAWAGWAVAASAPAADIAWFRASLKIGQLNQDKGVCVTVAVAIFNLIVGVAVAAFQKDRALLIPSAILGALPGGFKWLRLWAVYEQNPLATLGSLCAIDLIGQTASGGIAMYVNDQALNSAGQTVPA